MDILSPQNILLGLFLWSILENTHLCLKASTPCRTVSRRKSLCDEAMLAALLWWGGFFDVLGAPQFIWLCLILVALRKKEDFVIEHNKLTLVVYPLSYGLLLALYYWGGFFG